MKMFNCFLSGINMLVQRLTEGQFKIEFDKQSGSFVAKFRFVRFLPWCTVNRFDENRQLKEAEFPTRDDAHDFIVKVHGCHFNVAGYDRLIIS